MWGEVGVYLVLGWVVFVYCVGEKYLCGVGVGLCLVIFISIIVC